MGLTFLNKKNCCLPLDWIHEEHFDFHLLFVKLSATEFVVGRGFWFLACIKVFLVLNSTISIAFSVRNSLNCLNFQATYSPKISYSSFVLIAA